MSPPSSQKVVADHLVSFVLVAERSPTFSPVREGSEDAVIAVDSGIFRF